MANTKLTIGAVLGAVQSSAQSVVNVLDVGNTLIAKAQLAANTSLNQQRMDIILTEESFKENLIREKTMEDVISELKVHDFIKQSEQHKSIYEANYSRYSALLNPTA